MSDETEDVLGELRSAFAEADWVRVARLVDEDTTPEELRLTWLHGRLKGQGGLALLRRLVSALVQQGREDASCAYEGVTVRLEPDGRLYTNHIVVGDEAGGLEGETRWAPVEFEVMGGRQAPQTFNRLELHPREKAGFVVVATPESGGATWHLFLDIWTASQVTMRRKRHRNEVFWMLNMANVSLPPVT